MHLPSSACAQRRCAAASGLWLAVMRLHDVCAYEILGLKSGEVYGPGEIRKAFLRATLKAHPDKHEGDDEPWLVLKEAYDVLQDEVHRGIYDTALLNGHDMVCEKFLLYRGKKCISFQKGVLGGWAAACDYQQCKQRHGRRPVFEDADTHTDVWV